MPRLDLADGMIPGSSPGTAAQAVVEYAALIVREQPLRATDWFDWVYLWAGCPPLPEPVALGDDELFEEWLVERWRQEARSAAFRASAQYEYLRAEWERDEHA